MAPQRKRPKIRCDEVQVERFSAPTEDIGTHNWWEVFCFPYILCGRMWDCFITLCSGSNQCLVFWMAIQWVVCKITKMTTPGAIIFPYYFYMFCQVAVLTLFFVLLWTSFSKTVLLPYFQSFYLAMIDKEMPAVNTTPTTFRRYCFRKSDLFDKTYSSAILPMPRYYNVLPFFVDFIIDSVILSNWY